MADLPAPNADTEPTDGAFDLSGEPSGGGLGGIIGPAAPNPPQGHGDNNQTPNTIPPVVESPTPSPQPTAPAMPAPAGGGENPATRYGSLSLDRIPAGITVAAVDTAASADASAGRAVRPQQTHSAEVVLEAPAVMKLTDTTTVTVAVAVDLIGEHIALALAEIEGTPGIGGARQWAGGSLRVDRGAVVATLNGSDQFIITASGPAGQETRIDAPMLWEWTVEAIAAGDGVLILTVISTGDGAEQDRPAGSLTLSVDVPVDPSPATDASHRE
ncbi:MAG: hypothetical protein GY798_16120 [Hyphomicrobiales bacterium]|nr:hypothetical protein [Hyphomicrobiales bacterium]